jgi:hypothetical protein
MQVVVTPMLKRGAGVCAVSSRRHARAAQTRRRLRRRVGLRVAPLSTQMPINA